MNSDALVFYYNHGKSTGWFKVSEAIRRLRLGRQKLSLVSRSAWLCTDVPLCLQSKIDTLKTTTKQPFNCTYPGSLSLSPSLFSSFLSALQRKFFIMSGLLYTCPMCSTRVQVLILTRITTGSFLELLGSFHMRYVTF